MNTEYFMNTLEKIESVVGTKAVEITSHDKITDVLSYMKFNNKLGCGRNYVPSNCAAIRIEKKNTVKINIYYAPPGTNHGNRGNPFPWYFIFEKPTVNGTYSNVEAIKAGWHESGTADENHVVKIVEKYWNKKPDIKSIDDHIKRLEEKIAKAQKRKQEINKMTDREPSNVIVKKQGIDQ